MIEGGERDRRLILLAGGAKSLTRSSMFIPRIQRCAIDFQGRDTCVNKRDVR